MADPARLTFATDDWMFERQMRAELEAEAWRRMRAELASRDTPNLDPRAPPETAPTRRLDFHKAGSAILKAVVRFALAATGAYLGWLCAKDAGLGEFETWLALGAGFLVTLSFSLLPFARSLVHALAEGLRWSLVGAAAVSVIWLLLQTNATT
jgi:hypothetical protein